MKRRTNGIRLSLRADAKMSTRPGVIEVNDAHLPEALRGAPRLKVWTDVSKGALHLVVQPLNGPRGARLSPVDVRRLLGPDAAPVVDGLLAARPTTAGWLSSHRAIASDQTAGRFSQR